MGYEVIHNELCYVSSLGMSCRTCGGGLDFHVTIITRADEKKEPHIHVIPYQHCLSGEYTRGLETWEEGSENDLSRLSKNLNKDELKILVSICKRLIKGRSEYGPWRIKKDSRDFRKEALEEVYDALTYCAAELLCIEDEDD